MLSGVISVVVPCYNREKILWRFLDSVLNQTYKNIQLILIDDGSTDDTLSVIKSYEERFLKEGIQYEYHTKENGGVSSAINEGLRYVEGEFLCWPDSDDWYEPDAMEKRVYFLKAHPEYAIVSCDALCHTDGKDNEKPRYVSGKTSERFKEKQFKLMLKGRTLVCPICHMVRTEAFLYAHPKGKIFESRHGQNIQMLLPVYYHFRRGFIDEPLCNYMIFDNSLSRSDDTFEKKLAYRNAIELLTIATLEEINMPLCERKKYIKYVEVKNTRRRLLLAKDFGRDAVALEQLIKLVRMRRVRISDIVSYIAGKRPIITR